VEGVLSSRELPGRSGWSRSLPTASYSPPSRRSLISAPAL